jgi:hypothetical protein
MDAKETLPVGAWREVAMVVERRAHLLAVRWLASANADPEAGTDFAAVAGPLSHPSVNRLLQSKQPLLLGNDANLKAPTSRLELDEVRLYDRALAPDELAALEPGELSR